MSDKNTSDSARFYKSGAKSVYVGENFFNELDKMSVDLILTESRTHAIFPAISLWRGMGEVIKNDNVAAIFTSAPEISTEIYNYELNDLESAEKIIKFLANL